MIGARVFGALAVVATVAAAQLVTARVPVVDLGGGGPFVRSGELGEPVHLSYADVEVTDVRPAQYLGPPDSTALARLAGGVWVVVSVRLSATTKPVSIPNAWLVDPEGREYLTSTRSSCATNLRVSTGVPTYAVFCFDVPPDRLEGMHFRIARGAFETDQTNNDDLADVDLGVSAKDAETWPATTKAYRSVDYALEPLELTEITLTETGS